MAQELLLEYFPSIEDEFLQYVTGKDYVLLGKFLHWPEYKSNMIICNLGEKLISLITSVKKVREKKLIKLLWLGFSLIDSENQWVKAKPSHSNNQILILWWVDWVGVYRWVNWVSESLIHWWIDWMKWLILIKVTKSWFGFWMIPLN